MSKQSVLVVDSNATLLAVLEELVAGAGHSVAACQTFDTARAYLHTHNPFAVVTSVRLGAYNGLHLVSLVRQRMPGTVAIVYSGSEDVGLQEEARHWGATFLHKECLAHDLLPLLESLLGRTAASTVTLPSPTSSDLGLGSVLPAGTPLEMGFRPVRISSQRNPPRVS